MTSKPFRAEFECSNCGNEIQLGVSARVTKISRRCPDCNKSDVTFERSTAFEAVD